MEKIEHFLERFIFASRWLLAPFYLGLVGAIVLLLVKFAKEGVTIETKEGKTRLLECKTIIPVLPFSPNKEIAERAKGKVAEIYTIGDCDSPAVIPDATKAGWNLGNSL